VSPGKASNPPREAVLLVGAGYGALKVAEDLSHAGIPVLWATRAAHFLELPDSVEPFEQWPADLNYQFRPLYLRVTRHRLVTPLTQARLESVSPHGAGYDVVVAQDPKYIDYDLCTGCGRCSEVCPLDQGEAPPLSRTPGYCPSRALQLDKRLISPCRQGCPLGVNAQAYLALTATGRFDEALEVIKRDNPLLGVCGRVCHHPCEAACRRGELDQPLAIRDIKRFLFDYAAQQGPPTLPRPAAARRDQRVAVVGSGPAGLCAAHYLNQAGLQVTVLEALDQAGGMLRAGINAFRLPRKVLDAEIQALVDSGVEIKTNRPVEDIEALLAQGYRAVLLTTGTHQDLRLNIPGEDLAGVEHCVTFLAGVNRSGQGKVGPRTVIIGGGNSAMDAARTALRLGAEQVTVLAIETEDQLPAHPEEVRQAREEGVVFRLGLAPVEFTGGPAVNGIRLRAAHWESSPGGPPRLVFDSEQIEDMAADCVIVSIGQRPHLARHGLDAQLTLGPGDRLAADDRGRTDRPGVFVAGDVVTGPSTVVDSMAGGRRAAYSIIEYLGDPAAGEHWYGLAARGVGDYPPIGEDVPQQPRQEMARRQPKVRRRDFDEVDLGLSQAQAQAEATRCLQCGVCCECQACESACADIGAINHFAVGRRHQLRAPAVIVADRAELPDGVELGGDNVFWVEADHYSADLMDVLMAGGSAAGQAMAPAASLRVESVEPAPAAAPAGDPSRLGFFLCACNQTMAPAETLQGILQRAAAVPEVAHCELIPSACHPDGADRVARALAEKNLGRAILASCACCPINFACISCNDQRTRVRRHLFDRRGLERSRFELCNLRDHINDGRLSQDQVMERAMDLLRAAFIRSRYLGPLRRGDTELGNRILILGGSDIGVSAARNLAVQGFKVRLVHRCAIAGEELPEAVAARPQARGLEKSIVQVDTPVEITGIKGNIGDFTVTAKAGGRGRRWKADLVCLTDENLIPLTIFAGRVGLKKFYRYDFAFFHTPRMGIYRVMPRTLQRVDAFRAGAALAGEVATAAAKAYLNDHQLSPVVDPLRCRGCGRCAEICPFDAAVLRENGDGTYTAEVLRHNCVGCGGCVGRCPVTAMDIPFFSNQVLMSMVAGRLSKER